MAGADSGVTVCGSGVGTAVGKSQCGCGCESECDEFIFHGILWIGVGWLVGLLNVGEDMADCDHDHPLPSVYVIDDRAQGLFSKS